MTSFDRKKMLHDEMWLTGFTLFWALVAIVFFSIIVDLVFLDRFWFDFILLKLVLLVLYFTCYKYTKKLLKTPTLLLHTILFSFSFMCLMSLTQENMVVKIIYTNLLILVFISFNAIAIWKIRDGLLQYGFTLCTLFGLVQIHKITNATQLLNLGGYLFLSAGLVSVFFPTIRRNRVEEEISNRLKEKRKLEFLNMQLLQVQSSLKKTKKRIKKRNNQFSFIAKQVDLEVTEVKNRIENINEKTFFSDIDKTNFGKIKSSIHNISNQCKIFFEPLNLKTNPKDFNLSKETVDIKSIYLAVLSEFELDFKKKNIRIIEAIEEDDLNVLSDRIALEMTIRNMIEFAAIYSHQNNVIYLNLLTIENDLYFEIKNTGQDLLKTDFENYFKDIKHTKFNAKLFDENKKVSLSISKTLTENMGGYFNYSFSNKSGYEMRIQFRKLNQAI